MLNYFFIFIGTIFIMVFFNFIYFKFNRNKQKKSILDITTWDSLFMKNLKDKNIKILK